MGTELISNAIFDEINQTTPECGWDDLISFFGSPIKNTFGYFMRISLYRYTNNGFAVLVMLPTKYAALSNKWNTWSAFS